MCLEDNSFPNSGCGPHELACEFRKRFRSLLLCYFTDSLKFLHNCDIVSILFVKKESTKKSTAFQSRFFEADVAPADSIANSSIEIETCFQNASNSLAGEMADKIYNLLPSGINN